MKPELLRISNEEHHEHSSVGSTMLKAFIDDPETYYELYVEGSRKPEPSTKPQVFGTAFHTLLLEPERFNKGLFSSSELQALDWMRLSVLADDEARELIEAPAVAVEQTLIWEWSKHVTCKCRFDRLINRNGQYVIVDIKTAANPGLRAFRKACWDYGYFYQAALYTLGAIRLQKRQIPIPQFRWIAVGNQPPHRAFVYGFNESRMEEYLPETEGALDRLETAYESGVWEHPQSHMVTEL